MKKIIAYLTSFVIAILVFSQDNFFISNVYAAPSNPIPDGWYMVVSGNSEDRVLDINGWGKDNGTNLEIYYRNNTTNQRFHVVYQGNGYYTLCAMHSGKYIHTSDERYKNANAHQWESAHTNAQWAFESAGEGYYYLRNRSSGAYLDNSGGNTRPGNNVITYSFNGSNAQKWRFVSTIGTEVYENKTIENGDYMLESGNDSNRVLDLHNWDQNNGGNLEIYQKNGTLNQICHINYMDNGYYSLMIRHSNKYIHAQGSNSQTDNVHQWEGTDSNNALWSFEPAGDNYYYIRCKSGNYLDNSGGRTDNGNNVITYSFNGSGAQKWKLIPASSKEDSTSSAEKYYTTANLNLRKGRGTNYKKILVIPQNSTVSVASNSISEGWGKVTYNGYTGYCSMSYLTKAGTNPSNGNSTSNGGNQIFTEACSHLGKKYGDFEGLGFHSHKWCADFVSWCAQNVGQSKAIPQNASVSGLREAIKKAGGTEYSKASVKNAEYTPVKGDIIIFKSNNASHVGIVDNISNGRIYYIDGNNTSDGNGSNSCVHYSDCSVSEKTFTCVLKPDYR